MPLYVWLGLKICCFKNYKINFKYPISKSNFNSPDEIVYKIVPLKNKKSVKQTQNKPLKTAVENPFLQKANSFFKAKIPLFLKCPIYIPKINIFLLYWWFCAPKIHIALSNVCKPNMNIMEIFLYLHFFILFFNYYTCLYFLICVQRWVRWRGLTIAVIINQELINLTLKCSL